MPRSTSGARCVLPLLALSCVACATSLQEWRAPAAPDFGAATIEVTAQPGNSEVQLTSDAGVGVSSPRVSTPARFHVVPGHYIATVSNSGDAPPYDDVALDVDARASTADIFRVRLRPSHHLSWTQIEAVGALGVLNLVFVAGSIVAVQQGASTGRWTDGWQGIFLGSLAATLALDALLAWMLHGQLTSRGPGVVHDTVDGVETPASSSHRLPVPDGG